MKFFHGTRAALLAAFASGACILGHATTIVAPTGDMRTGTTSAGPAKCVAVDAPNLSVGAPLVQAACDGSSHRQMRLEYLGNGHHSVVVEHSNLCLGVAHGSMTQDAQIVQSDCAAEHAQWELRPHPSSMYGELGYTLKARHSGMCMDVFRYNPNDGAALVQFPCHGRLQQAFFFERNMPPQTMPVALQSSLMQHCISVEGGTDPFSATTTPCRGAGRPFDSRHQWMLKSHRSGTVQIVSVNNATCLDVFHDSTAAGTRVVQFPCHGGVNQQWRMESMASGFMRFVGLHSGMCLMPHDPLNPSGSHLVQARCIEGSNMNHQWWGLQAVQPRQNG
jgi:hypothetical protein